MKLIFVYITNPTKGEASRIAKRLIGKKLIACGNIFPIESIYSWKGKIAEEKEFVLVAKTDSKKYRSIVREVEKIHPYEIPCITQLPVKANGKYAKWLAACLK